MQIYLPESGESWDSILTDLGNYLRSSKRKLYCRVIVDGSILVFVVEKPSDLILSCDLTTKSSRNILQDNKLDNFLQFVAAIEQRKSLMAIGETHQHGDSQNSIYNLHVQMRNFLKNLGENHFGGNYRLFVLEKDYGRLKRTLMTV